MTSPESYWDALHEMPKGILDGLKNAELTEKEYRRLCPAMDRLWNAFGIRCLCAGGIISRTTCQQHCRYT